MYINSYRNKNETAVNSNKTKDEISNEFDGTENEFEGFKEEDQQNTKDKYTNIMKLKTESRE